MGQAKKRLMEYEYGFSIIERLISIFSSDIFQGLEKSEILLQLIDLREKIQSLDNNSMDTIELIANVLNDKFKYVYSELSSIHESVESQLEPLSGSTLNKIKNLISSLQLEIHKINVQLNYYSHKNKTYIIQKSTTTSKYAN